VHIRFATWNIGCGAKGFHGHNPHGLANAIIEHEIDICILQEVDAYARRSNFIDFPSAFKAATGHNAYYCVSVPFAAESGLVPRDYGNLLLSRYPLDHVETIVLEADKGVPYSHAAEIERRTAILAEIDVDGERLWCGGTHLAYSPGHAPSPIRRAQVKCLSNALSKIVDPDAPIVFGGDFNTAIGSEDIALLSKVLHPITDDIKATWPIGGKTEGHPNPFIAIDHIFGRGFIEARSEVIDYPDLTDHSLVIVDFIFQSSKTH
jgi:endonuclease/exonuclease/phosphatase family metal-dependent hydrolase